MEIEVGMSQPKPKDTSKAPLYSENTRQKEYLNSNSKKGRDDFLPSFGNSDEEFIYETPPVNNNQKNMLQKSPAMCSSSSKHSSVMATEEALARCLSGAGSSIQE